jgi:hypothetical protein
MEVERIVGPMQRKLDSGKESNWCASVERTNIDSRLCSKGDERSSWKRE